MANRAYLRLWTREFSESTLVEQFVRFLATAPLAASRAEFAQLTVQSIDASETPADDWDLRGRGCGPAEVAALAALHLHADTAYIAAAQWDLWQFDAEVLRWQKAPAPLVLTCHGPEYDDGIAATDGNFEATLGLEHFFTGHAGLLTGQGRDGAPHTPSTAAEDAVEHRFSRWMAASPNLREYHEKTRENIQQLFDWMEAIERALPIDRMELSSEGEENFEACLDAILAKR
jgi:hypothetical protein